MEKSFGFLDFIMDEYNYLFAFTIIGLCRIIPVLYFISYYLTPLFLIWGILIIAYKVVIKKQDIIKQHNLLGIFILSYIITIFINRINIVDNLKTVAWLMCYIYIVYNAFPKGNEENKHRFINWAKLIVYSTFMCSTISCIMYLTKFLAYIKTLHQPQQPQGLWGNRLVGVYHEANFGAMFALISIGLTIYLISLNKEKTFKKNKFYYINIIIQVIFGVWTLSRGGLVSYSIFAGLTVFFICKYFHKKIYVGIAAGIVAIGLYAGFFMVFPNITGYLPPIINAQIEKYVVINDSHRRLNEMQQQKKAEEEAKSKANSDANGNGVASQQPVPETITAETAQGSKKNNKISGNREYDKGVSDVLTGENDASDADFLKDISTGRLAAWKDCISVWLKRPIFGAGFKNISLYAKEVNPNGILARSSSVHNPFIRVLVSGGLMGISILMIWLCTLLWKFLNYSWKLLNGNSNDRFWGCSLFTLIIGLLAACCFLDALFLYTSLDSTIFWAIMGYMLSSMPNSNKESGNKISKIEWL